MINKYTPKFSSNCSDETTSQPSGKEIFPRNKSTLVMANIGQGPLEFCVIIGVFLEFQPIHLTWYTLSISDEESVFDSSEASLLMDGPGRGS